jgi:hypothetical protein
MARILSVHQERSRKNLLINGALDFWQRGTSFTSITTTPVYAADRWRMEVGGGSGVNINTTRQTSVPSDTSFPFSMRNLRTAGTGTSETVKVQRIEAVNIAYLIGKTLTFSFWAKAEGTSSNMFIRAFVPSSGTPDSWTVGRTYTNDTQIFAKNGNTITASWQKFTASFVVPSSAINGLAIGIGCVTTATNDGFSTTGFQLEEGPVVNDFVRAGVDIGSELALCQRYYEKSYPLDTPPGTSIGSGSTPCRATAASTGTFGLQLTIAYKVTKRAVPSTVNFFSTSGVSGNLRNVTSSVDVAGVIEGSNQFGVGIRTNAAPADGAGHICHFTSDAEL